MKLRRRYADQYTDPGTIRPEGLVTSSPEDNEEEATPVDWREPAPTRTSGDSNRDPDDGDSDSDPDDGEDERPVKRKRGIRIGQFFTGAVLDQDEFTRRLPVLVYIVFLMLLYIANGFHIQHKHSRLDQIADELKQLKTVAVTSSAVRMTNTRQSEIERLLREHNIPLTKDGTPPHIIKTQAHRH